VSRKLRRNSRGCDLQALSVEFDMLQLAVLSGVVAAAHGWSAGFLVRDAVTEMIRRSPKFLREARRLIYSGQVKPEHLDKKDLFYLIPDWEALVSHQIDPDAPPLTIEQIQEARAIKANAGIEAERLAERAKLVKILGFDVNEI
jgi:hypothetical protein